MLSFMGVLRFGETISLRRRGLGEDAMCSGVLKIAGGCLRETSEPMQQRGRTGLKSTGQPVRKDPSSSTPRDRLGWRSGSRGHFWEPSTKRSGGYAGAGLAPPYSSGWGYPLMSASGGAGGGPAALQRTTCPPPPPGFIFT